jgi:hypothetical protein
MHELKTEIIIQASPEKVWQLLMDFNNYPSWNPFINSISGRAITGEKISCKLRMENGKTMTFTPKVLAVEVGKKFEWLGHLLLPGLFDGNHYFYIEKINDAQVKFIHGERFKGILAGMVMKSIGEDTKKGFIKMNIALKEQAEK